MVKINGDKLINTTIVVLCVFMLLCGIRFINNIKDSSFYYSQDADHYLWYISEGNYSELPYRMYQSKHNDNPSEDLRECLAVSRYYLNTSYYKMYEEVGNSAKAEEYLLRMDENRRDMGDLSFTIAEINGELGVEPVYPVD